MERDSMNRRVPQFEYSYLEKINRAKAREIHERVMNDMHKRMLHPSFPICEKPIDIVGEV